MPRKSTTEPKFSKKSQMAKKQEQVPSHVDIALKAYLLWQEKGGTEMENWLEAERILMEKANESQ